MKNKERAMKIRVEGVRGILESQHHGEEEGEESPSPLESAAVSVFYSSSSSPRAFFSRFPLFFLFQTKKKSVESKKGGEKRKKGKEERSKWNTPFVFHSEPSEV